MNGKVDYNIEYGHVFADARQASRVHKESIERTKIFIKEIEKKKKSYVLTMLIDDYLPSYSYLNLYRFLSYFKENNVPPDYLIYEKRLLSLVPKIVSELPKNRIIKEVRNVSVRSNKDLLLLENKKLSSITLREDIRANLDSFTYTPALIAALFLIKLGRLSYDKIVTPTKYSKPKPFAAKKTVTIDPKAFKVVNDKALKIISMTRFKGSMKDMEFLYY